LIPSLQTSPVDIYWVTLTYTTDGTPAFSSFSQCGGPIHAQTMAFLVHTGRSFSDMKYSLCLNRPDWQWSSTNPIINSINIISYDTMPVFNDTSEHFTLHAQFFSFHGPGGWEHPSPELEFQVSFLFLTHV